MMVYLEKCKGDHCEIDPEKIRQSLDDIVLYQTLYKENINFKEKEAYPVYTDFTFSIKSIDIDHV